MGEPMTWGGTGELPECKTREAERVHAAIFAKASRKV